MIEHLFNGKAFRLRYPAVMGILNVTPDSFSDGGLFETRARCLERCHEMVLNGADIIDVGGESTRPGAERVDPEEQIRRTRDVIKGIRSRSDVVISIDTTRSEVARAGLDAGADVVNDVSAGTERIAQRRALRVLDVWQRG